MRKIKNPHKLRIKPQSQHRSKSSRHRIVARTAPVVTLTVTSGPPPYPYTHLSVDPLCEGGAGLGGGVLPALGGGLLLVGGLGGSGGGGGGAVSRLHGDELHLVGLATGSVAGPPRLAVHVVEDGRGGEQLVGTAA